MLRGGRHRVSDLVIACRNASATPEAYKATKGSCLNSRRREIGAPPARQADCGTPIPACEHCGALSTRAEPLRPRPGREPAIAARF